MTKLTIFITVAAPVAFTPIAFAEVCDEPHERATREVKAMRQEALRMRIAPPAGKVFRIDDDTPDNETSVVNHRNCRRCVRYGSPDICLASLQRLVA